MPEPALLTLGAPLPLRPWGCASFSLYNARRARALPAPVLTAPARSQTPSHPLALPPGGCLVSH